MGFTDPYLDPTSGVVRNRAGITDDGELARFEYETTLLQRMDLDTAIAHTFDADHLRAIHRHLFEPLFDWAGAFRTVDITKGGSTFMPVSLLETGAQTISASLGASGLLDPDVDEGTFIHEAAGILGDLNYLHPFREGNGRTQRAFLDHVAARSGRRLAWRNVGETEQRLAAIRTFNEGNGDAFEPLFARMLQPPLDGASPLDPDIYRVSDPIQAVAPRRRDSGLCGATTRTGTPCRRRGHCPYH